MTSTQQIEFKIKCVKLAIKINEGKSNTSIVMDANDIYNFITNKVEAVNK